MGFVKNIIEKLKLNELFGILFITSIIITIIPIEFAQKIQIDNFKTTYQTYLSLCIIVIGLYYSFRIVCWIKDKIWLQLYNAKKIAIKYIRETITIDEMGLLIEKYYDSNNNVFRSTAMIEISDGRKAALESKFILYRASSVSEWYSFAYNLQPYALEFLNKNLESGNFEIHSNSFKYKFN